MENEQQKPNFIVHEGAVSKYWDCWFKKRDETIRKMYAAWVSELTPVLLEIRDHPNSKLLGLGAFELGANEWYPRFADVIISPEDVQSTTTP